MTQTCPGISCVVRINVSQWYKVYVHHFYTHKKIIWDPLQIWLLALKKKNIFFTNVGWISHWLLSQRHLKMTKLLRRLMMSPYHQQHQHNVIIQGITLELSCHHTDLLVWMMLWINPFMLLLLIRAIMLAAVIMAGIIWIPSMKY